MQEMVQINVKTSVNQDAQIVDEISSGSLPATPFVCSRAESIRVAALVIARRLMDGSLRKEMTLDEFTVFVLGKPADAQPPPAAISTAR